MEEKILTIDDIQKKLRIGRNQAYKLVAEKKIKAFRTGRTWKITEKALEEFIKSSENSCKKMN
ncbi:MAG: helix-turn-helix domain-containing protein [Oscillospiraceae bacterium]